MKDRYMLEVEREYGFEMYCRFSTKHNALKALGRLGLLSAKSARVYDLLNSKVLMSRTNAQ